MTETDVAESEAPLAGLHPVFEREEPEPISTKEAADKVAADRRDRGEVDIFDLAIELKGHDRLALGRKASLKQGDLKRVASGLADFRAQREAFLSSLDAPQVDGGSEQPPQAAAEPARNVDPEQARVREAELAQVRAARQQYEQAVAVTLAELQRTVNAEFADLKTPADVAALATRDPPRYNRFLALAQHWQGATTQAQQLQAQNAAEQQEQWKNYAAREDQRFEELHPELGDPKTQARAQQEAMDYLAERGLSPDTIFRLWGSQYWFRAAETQKIILDASRWNAAQKGLRGATKKPLPPVLRPGAARDRNGDSDSDRIRSLSDRLNRSGGLRDAARLLMAQRRAFSRG